MKGDPEMSKSHPATALECSSAEAFRRLNVLTGTFQQVSTIEAAKVRASPASPG
jgi:hypothetical protein